MEICSIEGCSREAKVRGFCKPHYVRQWKSEKVSIEKREGNELYQVWCSKRKDRVPEWDSFEQFKADVGTAPSPQHRLWRLDKTKPYGPGNVKWRLTYAPKKEGETLEEYRPRAMRIHVLRYKYNITKEQYDQMYAAQNGGCAICKRPETAVIGKKVMELAVDHDHKTGKVRALLCSTCNTSLGGFQDSPKLLQAAIEYLKEHSDGLEEANDD
jgi:Recombination endonuclease VII